MNDRHSPADIDTPPAAIRDDPVTLRELELEYGLAKTGLRGTLVGALAVVLMVTVLTVTAIVTESDMWSGYHAVATISFLLVAVVAYGAFVYRRLVTLFGKLHAGDGIAPHARRSKAR